MIYRYRAYGQGGQAVSGEVESPSRAVAMNKLRGQGLLVDSLWPAPSLKISLQMNLTAPKLTLRQQAVFFHQLAMLVDGGVPLLQSLQVLLNSSPRTVRPIIERMIRTVESGQPLSRALSAQRGLFPRVATHVTGVAEMAGELGRGLQLLAEQFDAEDQLQRKYIAALTYPAVVLVMALLLAGLMVTFIVPQYATMFQELGAELPWQTRALLAVSDFVGRYWYAVLLLVPGRLAGFRFALGRSEELQLLVHRLLLRVPVFGPLQRDREAARYTRTLGTLLKSGVPVVSAAQAAAELVENAALANRLAAVPEAIVGGSTLARAIKETGAIPAIMAELLVVGEMIGNSTGTLHQVASLLDGEVRQTVERLSSILEPVLIVILGGIVLSVVLPLMLPMFELYRHIK